MRRILVAVAIALLLPAAVANAAPVVAGDLVRFELYMGNAGGGGAFAAYNEADEFLFTTFCLERDEDIDPGVYYMVEGISPLAWGGGINTDEGDPVDLRTAYLYTQWLTGAIEHTVYNANSVQYAMWWIEQELDPMAAKHGFVTEAEAAIAAGWTDAIGIQAMNMVTADGRIMAQDMLIPVPEPGSLLLLGAGLFGLAGIARRRR